MSDRGRKPKHAQLHRKLDVILAKANRQLKLTVIFAITSAYRLTVKACKP